MSADRDKGGEYSEPRGLGRRGPDGRPLPAGSASERARELRREGMRERNGQPPQDKR